MKSQVVLAFLLIALVSAQYKCPKFGCGSVNLQGLGDVCSKKESNAGDSSFSLKVCSFKESEICNFMFENGTSPCVADRPPLRSVLPGDPCQNGEDCLSNICSGGVCVGYDLGYNCKTHSECKVGAYCSAGNRCEALVDAGQRCGSSVAQCLNHLSCNLGVCVPLGSLENGSPADDLLACKSLYIKLDETGNYKCAEGPKLNGFTKGLIECNMGEMCDYTVGDDKFSTPCKCGVNGDGKSYCRPGEGNMAGEIKDFLKIAATSYDPPCHISNPWFCKRRLATSAKEFHAGFVAYKALTTPELYEKNDLCVQWNINKDYWVSYNIVHAIGPHNNTDGATTMTAGVSVLLALLLIELFFLF